MPSSSIAETADWLTTFSAETASGRCTSTTRPGNGPGMAYSGLATSFVVPLNGGHSKRSATQGDRDAGREPGRAGQEDAAGDALGHGAVPWVMLPPDHKARRGRTPEAAEKSAVDPTAHASSYLKQWWSSFHPNQGRKTGSMRCSGRVNKDSACGRMLPRRPCGLSRRADDQRTEEKAETCPYLPPSKRSWRNGSRVT